MAYPNIIWGEYGDEKVTSSTRINNLELGTRMYFKDGREFVYAKASATAMIAGNLYQQDVGIQGSDAAYKKDLVIPTSSAVGATTVYFTAGATTGVTVDQFKDGYYFINDVNGEGITYKVAGCSSAAAGSTVTVYLAKNDAVKVAIAAGSSQAGIRENPYFSCTINTADTVGVGTLAGIAPVAVTASYYCWLQTRGACAALTDGTVIVGVPVTPSGALAGAVAVHSAATSMTAKEGSNIGWCMNVAASTEYSLINLMIP